jgi:hypothetical protein
MQVRRNRHGRKFGASKPPSRKETAVPTRALTPILARTIITDRQREVETVRRRAMSRPQRAPRKSALSALKRLRSPAISPISAP